MRNLPHLEMGTWSAAARLFEQEGLHTRYVQLRKSISSRGNDEEFGCVNLLHLAAGKPLHQPAFIVAAGASSVLPTLCEGQKIRLLAQNVYIGEHVGIERHDVAQRCAEINAALKRHKSLDMGRSCKEQRAQRDE
jgi:hypothetical protein